MVRESAGALGLRKARRDLLKERLKGFRWHAAASLAAVAAVAAIMSLGPGDPPPAPDERVATGWERRFSSMERSLFAVEQQLSAMNTPAASAVSAGAPAAALGEGTVDGKEGTGALQEKLRATEVQLKKEEQRKAREMQRIEGELERLRRRLEEKLAENKAMEQKLSRQEGSPGADKTVDLDVTRAIIDQLSVENSELSEQKEAMKRVASKTIQSQNKQIERLTLERKKLLETLKKLKDIDSSDKTTMLSVGPQ
jgi:prefoldin subunit 5